MPIYDNQSLTESLKNFMSSHKWKDKHGGCFKNISPDRLSPEDQKTIYELFTDAFSNAFSSSSDTTNLPGITQKNDAMTTDNDPMKNCRELINQLKTILLTGDSFQSIFKAKIGYIAEELDFNGLRQPALTPIILFGIVRGFLRWHIARAFPEKPVDWDAVDVEIKSAIGGDKANPFLSEAMVLAADNLTASGQETTFNKKFLEDNLTTPLFEIIKSKFFWFRIHHEEVKKPCDVHNLFSGLIYNFLPRVQVTPDGKKIRSVIAENFKEQLETLQAGKDKFNIQSHCEELITAIGKSFPIDKFIQQIKKLPAEAELDKQLLDQNSRHILPGIIDGFCKWYAENAENILSSQDEEQFIAHKNAILRAKYPKELERSEVTDPMIPQTYKSQQPAILNFEEIVRKIFSLTADKNNIGSKTLDKLINSEFEDLEKIMLIDFFISCKDRAGFPNFVKKILEEAWATDPGLIDKYIDNRFEVFFKVFEAIYIDAARKWNLQTAGKDNPVDLEFVKNQFIQIKNEVNLAMLNTALLRKLQGIKGSKFITTIQDSSSLSETEKSKCLMNAAHQAIEAAKTNKPSLFKYFFSWGRKDKSLYKEQKATIDRIMQLVNGIRRELKNTESIPQSKIKGHTKPADAKPAPIKNSFFARFFGRSGKSPMVQSAKTTAPEAG